MNLDYINSPVRDLLAMLREHIRASYLESSAGCVLEKLSELEQQAMTVPAIVPWVVQRLQDRQCSGLTAEQLMLFGFATFSRSSSTYASIPQIVTVLAAAGDYRLASLINDNAIHEAGTSHLEAHPQLLLRGLRTLFDCIGMAYGSIGLVPLTAPSVALLRFFCGLSEEESSIAFASPEQAIGLSRHKRFWLPSFEECDFNVAKRYRGLVDSRFFDYHYAVIGEVLGMSADQADRMRFGGAPNCQRWLAMQALEFAFREASSADEYPERISYVGAFGELCKAYLGYARLPALKDSVMAWWLAHSDEAFGKKLGWGATAEMGHARDARLLVQLAISGISQDDLSYAIESATRMSRLRNAHWEVTVGKLVQLDSSAHLPFCS